MNRTSTIWGLIRLTRPANLVTAAADIGAGIAMAAFLYPGVWQMHIEIAVLVVSSILLYAGGVMLNDVFDARLDAVERPERPIPSGVVPKGLAALLGYSLLVLPVILCIVFLQDATSAYTASAIGISCILYDKWAKHIAVWGPLQMGICRGLNLVLGMSIIPATILHSGWVALVPLVYIAAITMISAGEVHGGKKNIMWLAMVLYITVIATLVFMAIAKNSLLIALPMLALFMYMILPPLWKAIQEPAGLLIGKAVKAGVIGLILMNATWAGVFNAPWTMLIIALMLPLSVWLAKKFAVT